MTKAEFARTKILATLGPATDSKDKLKSLINVGVDGLRLNFSHGSHEYFDALFNRIEEVCSEESLNIPILLDLQGPKIRLGELSEPEIEIETGGTIEITVNECLGTAEQINTSYELLPYDACIGDKILIDDGLIHLQVKDKTGSSVLCDIIEGGTLKPRKGMNLPGMKLSTAAVTEKDIADLEFALNYRVDFIALSFVRSPDDIVNLRKWLHEKGYKIPIIAKIEKPEALEKFDEILAASDGIMVARGDLGVEMNPEDVPIIQKNIIRKCKAVGKLVITATQMLESMISNPVPTRAEASDVANAVWDCTDVVMLSGETSVGKYALQAVRMMNNILLKTEAQNQFIKKIDFEVPEKLEDNLFDSTAKAVVKTSKQVNAKVIVVFTHFGRKAKVISKFHPQAPVIAFSEKSETVSNLNLYYGVMPFKSKCIDDDDECIEEAIEKLKEKKLVIAGDVVLITAGAPYTEKGRKSWMKFVVI
ncbi:MAG: pyruvate kinase [Melioribacteraceae bacterium]|nr:pyruvate kinase [Melioribacteraceae bacterium]MCF8354717.1 pyruvate kinase [Melioribacteraceae bacterium]MCF8394346.1 pyruvate kinase [Melioribacteraceae bacterium]MCF8420056.1 pyruvate kinase [Melioribacteraceae bacterium]